jgi:hypothetical protein
MAARCWIRLYAESFAVSLSSFIYLNGYSNWLQRDACLLENTTDRRDWCDVLASRMKLSCETCVLSILRWIDWTSLVHTLGFDLLAQLKSEVEFLTAS